MKKIMPMAFAWIFVSCLNLLCFIPLSVSSETYIPPGEYLDVANLNAMELIQNKQFGLLLDVSKPGERETGHVAESVPIPLEDLGKRLGEIEKYKDQVVLVISKFGDRSSEASRILAEKGFKKVYNIMGGMVDWKIMGYPVAK